MSNLIEEQIGPLLRETSLPAAVAAKRCNVSVGALVRWIRRGKVIDGRTVKLEGYPAGRGWMTTEEALTRFLTACGAAKLGTPAPESNSEQARRGQAAMARLNRALALKH